ncbi:hypothetical protein EMCRGX_G025779 [Ephydatia muelleri]|eukprot:Em0021g546a
MARHYHHQQEEKALRQEARAEFQAERLEAKAVNAALHGNIGQAIHLERKAERKEHQAENAAIRADIQHDLAHHGHHHHH